MEPMHHEYAIAAGALAAAAVTAIVGVLSTRWAVSRLPTDYFVRPPPPHLGGRAAARVVLGVILLGVGTVMLVVPGPGVATMVLGLLVADLPFNRHVAVWLLRRQHVAASITRMRKRAGQPPFLMPIPAHP
jgi:hypothetical protein